MILGLTGLSETAGTARVNAALDAGFAGRREARRVVAVEDGVALAAAGAGATVAEAAGAICVMVGEPVPPLKDASSVLASYARAGIAALEGLAGNFAVALWDRSCRRLALTRDRSGLVPLVAAPLGRGTAFASTATALPALGVALRPAERAIAEYLLFNHPLGPGTFWEDVRAVPPGRAVTWPREGGAATWPNQLPPALVAEAGSASEAERRLESELDRALDAAPNRPRTIYHLSGGLDTSLVCHAAARRESKRLRTVTVTYAADLEDVHYAALVAAEIGSDHGRLDLAADALPAAMRDAQHLLGGPVMAPGVITFVESARRLAPSCDVIVSGLGGDHPFVGRAKLGDRAGSRLDPGEVVEACAQVKQPTLDRLLAPGANPLRERIEDARLRAAESLPDGLAGDQVRALYEEGFLQEHLRGAHDAHAAAGIGLRAPLMPASLDLAPALARADATVEEPKAPLRSMLRSYGSASAERADKAQMALTLDEVRIRCADDIVATTEAAPTGLEGLDLGRIRALASGRGAASVSDLRMLWAVYNLSLWTEALPEWNPA